MPTGQELQALVNTPLEVEANGKTYKLARMTLRQYAELEGWAKEQPFVELRKQLERVKDAGVSKEAEDALVAEAAKASRDPAVIEAYMDGLAGTVRRFTMALSVHHPDATDEELDAVVESVALDEMRNIVRMLAGLPEEAEGKKDPAGPE